MTNVTSNKKQKSIKQKRLFNQNFKIKQTLPKKKINKTNIKD